MTGLAISYRQYDPSLLEPMRPNRSRHLEDLTIDLAAKTGACLLVSDSVKGPVRLGFPTVAAEKWLPRLWAD
jgi:hypothetical protein